MKPILLPLALVLVGLAGCADGGPAVDDGTVEGSVDETEFQLQAGKGAIEGLLVDDRFRPIDLEETPATSEQFTGFVLLQETGQQARTDENGQFAFVDLEPGSYTLRVTADGHEAIPQRVNVDEGTFAEAQVLARRILSAGGTILSQEYSSFVPCGMNLIVTGQSFDCTFDQSGDSSREAFTADYTGYPATHVVMEMDANSPQYFDVWLQPPGNEYCDTAYQIMGGPDTDYLRWQLDLGEVAVSSPTASGADCEPLPWNNDTPLQTVVYLNSLGFDEGVGFGVGAYVGVQANFVLNLFLGPPDVDVDVFCVLC